MAWSVIGCGFADGIDEAGLSEYREDKHGWTIGFGSGGAVSVDSLRRGTQGAQGIGQGVGVACRSVNPDGGCGLWAHQAEAPL